jgi:acetyl-CoA carboxylase biotin carboxyl carrier protein
VPAAVVALAEGVVEFKSPMVGTIYRAAAPDAQPFVKVGDRVVPETTLCLIEAMKVMNEIKAETSAEVVEILVQNGEAVEFGQPLLLLRPTR